MQYLISFVNMTLINIFLTICNFYSSWSIALLILLTLLNIWIKIFTL